MVKIFDIAVKNIKTTYRDKKSWIFLLMIPIFYFVLMGAMFRGLGTEQKGYIYQIGYVNQDYSTIPEQSSHNISFITQIINETDSFKLHNYSSLEMAKNALSNKELDSVLVFHEGFQDYLNKSSTKKYAMFDNDTSTHDITNYTHSVNFFISTTSGFMDVTNITGLDFNQFLSNFNTSEFDFILVFQEQFEYNLDNGFNTAVDFYFRNGTDEYNLYYQEIIIMSLMDSVIFSIDPQEGRSTIIINQQIVSGSSLKFIPPIEFFFRDSADPTLRQIIKGTLQSIIGGIINFNPYAIELDFEESNISGLHITALTVGTPGYILYGMFMVLSLAAILITNEKKTGVLKRLESSSMKPFDMLGGHVISNTIIMFIQTIIGLLTLAIFGFVPVYSDILTLIFGMIITVILASLFLNALSLFTAGIFKSPDASAGGVWIFLLPLMTFSGAFFPLELVAPALIPYCRWIPTRIVVLLMQDIMVNQVALTSLSLWVNFGLLALEGGIFFIVGMKLYQRFARS